MINDNQGLYSVGFYDERGVWHIDSMYDTRVEAMMHIRYLAKATLVAALEVTIRAIQQQTTISVVDAPTIFRRTISDL
jgi:hypothetical protein